MNNIKQALESAIGAFEDAHEEHGIWYRTAIEQCKAALAELEQQQQWVELSDAEIFELCPYIDHDLLEEAFYRGARAVEAKLKELNT